jgi:hypothetical protein
LLVVVTLLATRRSVMGTFVTGRVLAGLGWVTAALMGSAAVAMLWPG